MIEGGGLGSYDPTAIGPVDVQVANGVVDVLVADETEAVVVAKQYLSYFRGDVTGWECADQQKLRHLVPENRVRAYDVRTVIDALCDTGSVLELRRGFGEESSRRWLRIGRAVGIANNPSSRWLDRPRPRPTRRVHRAAARSTCRSCSSARTLASWSTRIRRRCRPAPTDIVTGANVSVPCGTVILPGCRLNREAMAGGSFRRRSSVVATGEFDGMNLEGRCDSDNERGDR
jgi:hypothetical protein